MESHCGQIEWAPRGWELIATNGEGGKTKTQCLRLKDHLIYAAQFHIEMDGTPDSSRKIMSNFWTSAGAGTPTHRDGPQRPARVNEPILLTQDGSHAAMLRGLHPFVPADGHFHARVMPDRQRVQSWLMRELSLRHRRRNVESDLPSPGKVRLPQEGAAFGRIRLKILRRNLSIRGTCPRVP